MKNDAVYLATMRCAEKLFRESIISTNEYLAFEIKMKEKYHPVFTGILTDIDLIIPE